MIQGIRIALFFASSLGYVRYFETRFNYNTRLAWIAVFTMNVWIIYLMSLMNLLNLGSVLVFFVGFLLFINTLVKNRNDLIVRLFKPDFVKLLMLFYLVLFGVTLLKTTLVHFDNFSHWALIVKFLFTQGRLPIATDAIISFSSYPLGASLFVYYFTVVVGYSEGVMLLGQFVFIMAALYAMFAVIRDDKRILVPTLLFTILTIMNHFNIAIRYNNLLVDFVLPALTLACIAGIYTYRYHLKRMSLHAVLVLGILLIVKNSAIFFVVIALVYYLYNVFRYHKKKIVSMDVVFTIGLVMVPFLFWKIRMDTVFVDVVSKHSVNVDAYRNVFALKTPEMIRALWDIYWRASVDIYSLAFQGILFINLLFIILFSVMKRVTKADKYSLFPYASLNVMFLVYYFGIFLMFIFSMPLDEARHLAGFERYASSIVILGLGIFGMVASVYIDRMFYVQDTSKRHHKAFKSVLSKSLYQYATMLLLFFSITLLLSENNGMLYNNRQNVDSFPNQLKEVVSDQSHYNKQRVLLVASDEKGEISNYYAQFVARYYLFTNNVDAYPQYEMDNTEFIEILKNYDIIVMPNKNYTFIEKIRQTTGMHVEETVYKTDVFLKNLK